MISTGGTTTLGLYDFKSAIDDFGRTDYWVSKPSGYPINQRVMLSNGDIVKSTIVNNTENPNVNMTGWIKDQNKNAVGLGDVDNTSDLNKPVSIATEQALLLKSDLAYVDTVFASLTTLATKFYPSLVEANADIANLSVNQPVQIGEVVNGGLWYKATTGATSLTKSPYDALEQSKGFTYSALTAVAFESFTQGTYVRADGTTASSAGFASTDFIDVIEGQQYTIYSKLRATAPIVWFDKNKVLLSIDYADQTSLSVKTYTAPQGAKSVRVNLEGIVNTVKPYIKSKAYKPSVLNDWFNQYQNPVVQEMIDTAVGDGGSSVSANVDKLAIDSAILQGAAPYWVKRAADGSAATLDFDLDNNLYFYRGVEYTTLADAIAAIGGLSKVVYEDTKAFVLNGNTKEGSENLAKYADTSTLDVSKFTLNNTTVSKSNSALAVSRNASTTGTFVTLPFKVKANTTYVIKSANTTGLSGVRLSIKNSLGTSVLSIGTWQTATEELREFISTNADTYTLKIEIPGNGATSYLSYIKLHESVAFSGLNKDGFTIVADFTPQAQTGNECYLLVGQTATGRASYNNHFATVRIAGSHNFPTTSNMMWKDGNRAAYVPNSDTGHNIAQVGNKTTFAMSIGGGFVALSSGYQTKLLPVDQSQVDLMNSAMIAVGCGGSAGNEKATATLNRFSVISKSYKDLSQSSGLFTNYSDKFLILGDSFATKLFADSLQSKLTGKTVFVDGVGGSNLYQQAKRFESEPKLWNCTLIIMDGGFEWTAKYGLDFVNPIQRILTCLESTGNSKYYYVEPSPAGFAELAQGTSGRADWDAGIARIKKMVGNDRYIPTLTQMQTFGDGSTSDNALIAQNLMPVSLTIDGQHENAVGTGHRTDIIKTWIDSHPL